MSVSETSETYSVADSKPVHFCLCHLLETVPGLGNLCVKASFFNESEFVKIEDAQTTDSAEVITKV